MKHDNGDMDDLFRRASEKYPLRIDSADWDRLAAALEKAPDSPSDPEAVDERRRKSVFWWFLLLPLGGLGYFTWQATMHAHPAVPVAITKTAGAAGAGANASTAGVDAKGPANASTAVASTTDASITDASTAGASTAGAAASTAGAGAPTVGAKGAAAQTTGAVGADADAAGTHTRVSAAADENYANNIPASRTRSFRTRAEAKSFSAHPGATATTRARAETGGHTAGAATTITNLDDNDQSGSAGAAVTGTTGNNVTGTNAIGKNVIGKNVPGMNVPGTNGATAQARLFSHLDLRPVPTGGDYNLVVNVKARPAAVDSSNNVNKKKSTASAAKKSAHGYIGISGAPDLSTVRFQSMKGVGSTFGVLLGYSFNDRWAVESGLYLDRKRYYTEGEYFNKEGVHTYPNTNLLNVDGTCYMWEIPINLRYNFNTSPRMKWFATAGLSTYLMSKENYAYQYQYTWGGSVEDGSWNLKKPSQYWFSIVNISAGFEQRLGKIGNLRLEPYLRLPLSGIGTGRLPILSAGLNIGITRQLW